MSIFPVKKEISNYQVSFLRLDNRKRSLLRRRFAAMSTALNNIDDSKLSEKEKEVLQVQDSAEMMNHKFYEEVRDLIFSIANIEGVGNALKAFNGIDGCFEESDELELMLFMEGVALFLGKSGVNTDNANTPKMTQ